MKLHKYFMSLKDQIESRFFCIAIVLLPIYCRQGIHNFAKYWMYFMYFMYRNMGAELMEMVVLHSIHHGNLTSKNFFIFLNILFSSC